MLLIEFSKDQDPRNHSFAIVLEHLVGVQQSEIRKRNDVMRVNVTEEAIQKSNAIKSEPTKPFEPETENVLQLHMVGGKCFTLYGWNVEAWRRYIQDIGSKMSSNIILPKK